MMFNNRRQSQDRLLREQMIHETKDARLWMNHYSLKQFADIMTDNIMVDDDFLNKAEYNEYSFVENLRAYPYENKINKIILYKWNRRYPADFWFDITLKEKWKLVYAEDFKGYSHEKITKEIYIQ